MRSNSITSISSISSRASSAEPEPTMQIFVTDIAGETFALTIPQSTTISTLRSMLALRTNVPESSMRIVHAGKHLSLSTSTLASYSIAAESTLHMALPIRGGAPKKIRCAMKDCKEGIARITGDCTFCNKQYCNKHRMLESHSCEGLENCKKEEKERNREKLESERTVAIKGI
ncbi:Putative Zinc finger, AN1-type, Ubiquitin-like domain, Ubiquitin-like domain superfamily [Septoria linicola]|uniref:Zinc finger, AN1-type, Ubiquitin-like domain, Ubiquitin-like domain superfamily n=1 Tax=Septoria linicola TaxID=215465 RepID=A0A9Q9B1B7_9PEZI|nr:Putative Zinc finger, AN1-type, Ubiquitin-like domain, Ubiquitin-like domain superfamily [Septoria linicola]